MKCRKCNRSDDTIKIGFKKTKNGKVQKFKCKNCNYSFTENPLYTKKNITTYHINYLRTDKNLSLREIARIEGVALSTIQYHINKEKSRIKNH